MGALVRVLLFVLAVQFSVACRAELPREARFQLAYSSGSQAVSTGRFNRYLTTILQSALERTRPEFGDFRLETPIEMTQARRLYALTHDDGSITTTALSIVFGLRSNLVPVRIPLELGTQGYRVLLIRADHQKRFDKVRSAEDLKQLSIGMGEGWSDVPILRASGFIPVVAESFDGLMKMLMAGRIDGINRGIFETTPEFDDRMASTPELAIERHLLLHYPKPFYFWFADSELGRRQAHRVEAGLNAMVADGSLRALFEQNFAGELVRFDLPRRRIIDIPNLLLDAKNLPDDPRMWLNLNPVGLPK